MFLMLALTACGCLAFFITFNSVVRGELTSAAIGASIFLLTAVLTHVVQP